MGVGFIREKIEIKFLILYIAARVLEPLPLEGMQELTMCDEGIDYFAFSECLGDLVRTEHLRLTEQGTYCITPKGMKNSAICETSLPYSIRVRTDKNVAAYNQKLLRQSQVRSSVIPRKNGTYTVELSLDDDLDNVMRLQLMVAGEEMAHDLADRFQKSPEQVYSSLITTLFRMDNEK